MTEFGIIWHTQLTSRSKDWKYRPNVGLGKAVMPWLISLMMMRRKLWTLWDVVSAVFMGIVYRCVCWCFQCTDHSGYFTPTTTKCEKAMKSAMCIHMWKPGLAMHLRISSEIHHLSCPECNTLVETMNGPFSVPTSRGAVLKTAVWIHCVACFLYMCYMAYRMLENAEINGGQQRQGDRRYRCTCIDVTYAYTLLSTLRMFDCKDASNGS